MAQVEAHAVHSLVAHLMLLAPVTKQGTGEVVPDGQPFSQLPLTVSEAVCKHLKIILLS